MEVSTAAGYATMFMALALKQNNGGRIDTYEIDARAAQSAEQLFAAHGLNKYVNLICGDAKKHPLVLLRTTPYISWTASTPKNLPAGLLNSMC